jgi:hypothetical protein
MVTEVYEQPKRCSEDSARWFERNYSHAKEPVSVQGGASSTVPLEYQRHYSQAKKGCFAVLSLLTSFKNESGLEVTHSLWDVNENSKLGAYVVKNVDAMMACEVLGVACTSKEQWLEMIRPYIGE